MQHIIGLFIHSLETHNTVFKIYGFIQSIKHILIKPITRRKTCQRKNISINLHFRELSTRRIIYATNCSCDELSGRPSAFVTEQTIDARPKIVEDDSHSMCQQIEAILGISSTAFNSLIHHYLNLRKVCARWVPHTLTDDQKQLRLQFCRHSLKRFEEGRSRRVFDIITGDESCFYHDDPELKEQ